MSRSRSSSSRQQRRRRGSLLTLGAALSVAMIGALPSEAAPTPRDSSVAVTPSPSTAIRLITGDVVRVRTTSDGHSAVVFEESDEQRRFFQQTDAAGDLHVIPAELLPLVPERLDPRLFNVSALARDGYGGRTDAPQLPLIVSYGGQPVPVPGIEVQRALPSIDAATATIDASEPSALGAALTRTTPTSFLAGVDKLWLDGPMTTSLDESVPQIGAPAAWEQGFEGSGVTIAVVDTGIDDSHPDLAGRVVAAELFAEADSTDDVFGHGTHVASIAAGDGAASDGQFSGVAYGADLVSAKVLSDDGFGLESWVIAGMEWSAIDEDADVVNMSLTGGPSDGTDPVSQAVEALSAEEGALFVTAAGNFGGMSETVEAPSSAPSALAVGAVDKQDGFAFFSAWGPVLDGTAVKPEIVAPGVDITAARAEGSEIGLPVGEHYMELSGTSMAAPHVAGAAALLLEANPDWSWSQLKNALVTSAADVGLDVFQQGGGRVDVATALYQTVHSDVATIDFGAFEFPHDDGDIATAEVTLTNDGDAAVDLDLAASATDAEGEAAPSGMLTVEPAAITLAAGAAETVSVTADEAAGAIGLFGGELTATADGVEALHIPLAVELEEELFDLTITALDRQGGDQMFASLAFLDVGTAEIAEFYSIGSGANVLELRVPAGVYSATMQSFDETDGLALVDVSRPEFDVAADREVVLDSRDTVEATYTLPDPADLQFETISSSRTADQDLAGVSSSMFVFDAEGVRTFAAPTDPITLGRFQFDLTWNAVGDDNTYYNLFFPNPDAIPADLEYVVTRDTVAVITSEFARDVPGTYIFGQIGITDMGGGGVLSPVDAPGERVDWVTTGGGVRWFGELAAGEGLFVGEFAEFEREYVGGDEVVTRWLSRPVRPGVFAPFRVEDFLGIAVLPFEDPEDHYGYTDPGVEFPSIDDVSYTLSADGSVLLEGTGDLFTDLEVEPTATDYTLTMDAARTTDWWLTSPETSTTWRFTSARPDGAELAPVPMLQVDYDIDLALDNTADAPTPVTFHAYNFAEIDDADATVATFEAWSSTDDGATWTSLDVTDTGGGTYESLVPVVASGPVSLRVAATDDGGSSFDQEILRAYGATFVAPTATPTVSPTITPTASPTTTAPTTPIPTTTLPTTGASHLGSLVGLGLGGLLLGAAAVAVARRRLQG